MSFGRQRKRLPVWPAQIILCAGMAGVWKNPSHAATVGEIKRIPCCHGVKEENLTRGENPFLPG